MKTVAYIELLTETALKKKLSTDERDVDKDDIGRARNSKQPETVIGLYTQPKRKIRIG